jgi:hypothetical protein
MGRNSKKPNRVLPWPTGLLAMPLYRTWLGFFLLASGVATAYAFVRSFEPVSVSRVILQDETMPSLPIFPKHNLDLDVEHTDSVTSGISSGETKTPQPAALTSSGTQDLAPALQTELARAGCYAGPVHGRWDQRSKNAVKEFLERVNAQLPIDQPDSSLLALVRSTPGSVCAGSQRPSSVVTATATPPLATEAASLLPSVSRTESAPGAMGLGGPIMVPVATIAEGQESVLSQTVTVVAPASGLEQVENTAPIKSSPRPRPQHESGDFFRHPLGF